MTEQEATKKERRLTAELYLKQCAEIDRLEADKAELLKALEEAVEIIHTWHNIDTARILSKTEHEITWKLYQKSPEMTRINAAIAKAKGGQS